MKRSPLIEVARWAALLLITIWCFGPILIILFSSFKPEKEIFTYVPHLLFHPVIDNYTALIRDWPSFWIALKNSLIVVTGSSALVILASLPAAYSYSRMKAKGLSVTALFIIAVRMFPPIVITIPLYPLFQRFGLIDTPLALILVYSAFQVSLSTWILKSFIDSVPRELEEAAWVDGCTRSQSFVRIVMPVIAPGLVAATIFVCLFAWNDFMFALLFTGTNAKTTPVLISEMLGAVGEGGINWGTVFAAASIQLLPILTFIWIIQKRLVQGMTIGAVKG